MSKKLYSYKPISYWYSYEIEEICHIFKDNGLHPQTVRRWINKEGLSTIDKSRPTLIYGYDLINFLKKRNQRHKKHTSFEQFFCMKCQDGRNVFRNIIQIEQSHHYLKAKARCRDCKTIMNKSYKITGLPDLRQQFQLGDVLELYDCLESTAKTHLAVCVTQSLNESLQGNLFL